MFIVTNNRYKIKKGCHTVKVKLSQKLPSEGAKVIVAGEEYSRHKTLHFWVARIVHYIWRQKTEKIDNNKAKLN